MYDLMAGNERHEGGWKTCYVEATMHIVNILDIPFALMLISWNLYMRFHRSYILSWQHALRLSLGLYGMITIITFVVSKYSPPELQPAGLYCFPRFDSPLLGAVFLPGAILSVVSMIVFFGLLYHHLRQHERRVHAVYNLEQDGLLPSRRIAWLSYWLLFIFLIGYGKWKDRA